MKNLKILLLVIMSLLVLTACNKEVKKEEVAVQFVEMDGNKAIYVSHEKKQYYTMYVDKYIRDFQMGKIENLDKIYLEGERTFFKNYKIYAEIDGEEHSLSKKY